MQLYHAQKVADPWERRLSPVRPAQICLPWLSVICWLCNCPKGNLSLKERLPGGLLFILYFGGWENHTCPCTVCRQALHRSAAKQNRAQMLPKCVHIHRGIYVLLLASRRSQMRLRRGIRASACFAQIASGADALFGAAFGGTATAGRFARFARAVFERQL